MEWKNLFDRSEVEKTIARVKTLRAGTRPQWGKMNAGEMLAHCNVAYDLVYTDRYPKPKGLQKFLIKLFAKPMVVGPRPYKKNTRTAPIFLVGPQQDFDRERDRLITNLVKTQELGPDYFNNRESHGFGKLTTAQWNTLFSKHLEHHLRQFGA